MIDRGIGRVSASPAPTNRSNRLAPASMPSSIRSSRLMALENGTPPDRSASRSPPGRYTSGLGRKGARPDAGREHRAGPFADAPAAAAGNRRRRGRGDPARDSRGGAAQEEESQAAHTPPERPPLRRGGRRRRT